MNYAVEITGCAQLAASEQERIASKFRESLELGLGGAQRVRQYLEAFLRVTEPDPGYQLNEVDIRHATAYVSSHQTAEFAALDGRHEPGSITVLVWPAH